MKKLAIVIFALIACMNLSIAQTANAQNWGDTSKAQTGLVKEKLIIKTQNGKREFTVEMADTYAKQQVGMMWRTTMNTNDGMLFDYVSNPHRASFWMENTLIPLDLIFIRSDGTIANIAANAKPLDRTPIYARGVISAVLEIKGGEAARQGIKAGDIVEQRIFGNYKITKQPIYKKKYFWNH